MRAKRTKTDAFDWAAIRWARLREEDEPVAEPRLDPPKNERGRLVDPIGFLSERAKKILGDAGISATQFRERVLFVWFFSLIFVAALGASVFPFARADRLLGGGVNLAGPFVFFLLGQIFFLATSLIFVLFATFQAILRKFRKADAPRTFSEKAVERLCGLVGWLALVGLRRGIRFFYAFFGERRFGRFFRKSAAKNAENDALSELETENEIETDGDEKREKARRTAADAARKANARRVALRFWDSIFEKPRFLFFWGGVLSHLFWASCSICILSILVVRMQGNRYDYRWHTSLEDERVVKKCVDFLGAPIAKLGGRVPTEEDVKRLFVDDRALSSALTAVQNGGGSASRRANASLVVVLDGDGERTAGGVKSRQDRRMEAKTRALWSRFLLSVVFIWCVAPRCLLVGANYVLLRRSLRDFRPDLRDPYFKRLIDRAEAYSTTTRAAVVFDSLDDEAEAEIAVPEAAEPAENPVPEAVEPAENPVPEAAEPAENPVPEAVEPAENPVPEAAEPAENPESEAAPVSEIALALGYDATISPERWRDLLGAASAPVLFGDVAADFDAKKRFRNWAKTNGAAVALCVVATDVGLSPARHCVRFLRDDLGAAFPNARIFVVLSGGEKLRRKYGATAPDAVAQRLDDWRAVVADLAKTTGVPFEPIFFFDAEIDLPEERARLRRILTSALGGGSLENGDSPDETAPKNFAKWNAAADKIAEEARRIFDENADSETPDESAREERDRRRIALLGAEIFAVYRAETDALAENGADESRRRGFDVAAISRRLAKIGENVGGELGALGENVVSELGALAESGGIGELGRDALEKNLTRAFGLSLKTRDFCKNLSPKCAVAFAAVGVSLPVAAAFAPLFGGALTATAVASTLGSLGTLLPTAAASGATGAALGALAPTSLAACKRKIVETWRGARGLKAENALGNLENGANGAENASNETAISDETLESVAVVVCVATTWAVALELQGLSEEKIVAALPVATRPLETSPLDSPETVRAALDEIAAEIRRLRERNAG